MPRDLPYTRNHSTFVDTVINMYKLKNGQRDVEPESIMFHSSQWNCHLMVIHARTHAPHLLIYLEEIWPCTSTPERINFKEQRLARVIHPRHSSTPQ